MIITIDGPASAGKGTLAKEVAARYGLAYFDTGMIYRAVGLEMYLSHKNLDSEEEAEKVAKDLSFAKMISLSEDADFRSPLGGKNASIVSAYPKVREALLKMQQDFAKNPILPDGKIAKGVVYDGRDTGTVVCPRADIKLFITATAEVRAQRRYKEFQSKGLTISYEEVLKDIIARDERDSKRSSAPLKPAEDAFIIDTSLLTIEQVREKVFKIIDSH